MQLTAARERVTGIAHRSNTGAAGLSPRLDQQQAGNRRGHEDLVRFRALSMSNTSVL